MQDNIKLKLKDILQEVSQHFSKISWKTWNEKDIKSIYSDSGLDPQPGKLEEITGKTGKMLHWIMDYRRNTKGKGEKERYAHLNAELQRIARWDKKAFLGDQCKETEEDNRMGKTKDLFKKIRGTKGTFHAKMGTIKDRNSTDLTEAEDIQKRWQEYMEELHKKHLHDT